MSGRQRLSRARFAISAVLFVHGAVLGNWVARIPAVQQKLHLSSGPLGLALLGSAIGAMFMMPVTGMLIARRGSTVIAKLSTFAYCLAICLPPLAVNGPTLMLALAVFGVCGGAMNVSMNTQAVLVEKAYGRPIMSSVHALFSIGGMIGAFTGSFAAGARWSPEMHLGIAAVLLCIFSVAISPWLWEDHEPHDPEGPSFARPTRALLGPSAISFCIMCCEGAMADWSAVYLRSVVQAAPAISGVGYAFFSMSMAAGRLFGDHLTGWLGPVRVVQNGTVLAAVGLSLAVLWPSTPPVLLGFLCMGAGVASLIPIVFTAVGRTPGIAPAAGLAAVTTCGYVGLFLGPPVIGFLAEWLTLRGALVFLLGLLMIALSQSGSTRHAAGVTHAVLPDES